MYLINRKEPSYIISTSTVKDMFSTLSNNQIRSIDYDLSSSKDFIMNHIPIIFNYIRFSSRSKNILARLHISILRNNGNTFVIYKEYYIIIRKDSFENNE